MEEWSRILIEEYCRNRNSARSRRLQKLVEKSYDMYSQYTDSDGRFMEDMIKEEKDPELRDALKDLDEFMFGY